MTQKSNTEKKAIYHTQNKYKFELDTGEYLLSLIVLLHGEADCVIPGADHNCRHLAYETTDLIKRLAEAKRM